MTPRDLTIIIVLGFAAHQLAYLITQSVLFADFRLWVMNRFGYSSKVTYLSSCHLCASQWTSAIAAAVAVQRVAITDVALVDWMVLSFAIAVIARVTMELWSFVSSLVDYLQHRRDAEERAATLAAMQMDARNSDNWDDEGFLDAEDEGARQSPQPAY